jgi:hypothetical protein
VHLCDADPAHGVLPFGVDGRCERTAMHRPAKRGEQLDDHRWTDDIADLVQIFRCQGDAVLFVHFALGGGKVLLVEFDLAAGNVPGLRFGVRRQEHFDRSWRVAAITEQRDCRDVLWSRRHMTATNAASARERSQPEPS